MGPGNIIVTRPPRSLAPIALAYERRFKRYGSTPKGVFWKNAEWQRQRYDIMARIFDNRALAGGLIIHDFGPKSKKSSDPNFQICNPVVLVRQRELKRFQTHPK